MDFKSLCGSTKISELLQSQKQELVTVKSDADLSETFDIMIKKRIHSAPVIDPKTHQYVGILDMKDFVAYILWLFGDKNKTSLENMAETTTDIMNLWKKNPFVAILDSSPVWEALDYICKSRAHNIPVVDSKSKVSVSAMLSQSTLISWISQQSSSVLEPINVPIEKLLSSAKKLITVKHTDKMLSVYQTLYDNDIYGCAVVDGEGKLVGNISVTDLQFSVNDNIDYLMNPSSKMLEHFTSRYKPIVCTAKDMLPKVLETVAIHGIHRIYVVDEHNKPLQVLTLTDMVQFIWEKLGA